jgi:hypothetical protein
VQHITAQMEQKTIICKTQRSRVACKRAAVLNAVRYPVARHVGSQMLPIQFPLRQMVSWWAPLTRQFPFETIHYVALIRNWERGRRKPHPTAGVIDS